MSTRDEPRRTALGVHARVRQVLGALALAAFASLARGQSPELVLRGPDPAVVRPGGAALVTLVLVGSSGAVQLEPLAPIADLAITVGAPETSTLQTLVDGRMLELAETSWELELRPARAGRFELPPLRVRVGDEVLASSGASLECADDLRGEPYAFVEMRCERASYYVQERIPLTLVLGVDREFLRTNVVQLSARSLDVPVRLDVPWLAGLPRADVLPRAESAPRLDQELLTFALNDGIARGVRAPDRRRDGRSFLVLEMQRTLLATRTGVLRVPAPSMSFAFATQFERGAFAVASADDWQLAHVDGEPLEIAIEPLPRDGRPLAFGGAVGQFELEARVGLAEVQVGQSLRVEVTVSGTGNLASFEPPSLHERSGFRIQGMLDDRDSVRRTIVYDLTPESEEVREVPAIELHFFDPSPGARDYRTAATEPKSIRVRPRVERVPAPVESVPGTTAAPSSEPGKPSEPARGWLVPDPLLGGTVVAVLAVFVLLLRRRREPPARPEEGVSALRAAPAAARELRAALAAGGAEAGELLRPFADYLAARLACEPAAVVGPGLEPRLLAAGVPAELAARTARALDELSHARFGGAHHAPERADLLALLEELEALR